MPKNQLAAVEDVQRLLKSDLADEDTPRVEALIMQAGDLIEGYIGRTLPNPIPEKITRLVARMVARAVNTDTAPGAIVGTTSVSFGAGPFSRSLNFADGSNDGGVWLTKQDKLILSGMTGKAFTVRMW